MYVKKRRILPILLILLLFAGAAVGGWLWYDNNVDRSGWVEKDGVRFYQDFHADPVSGWLELPDGRYYLNPDGTPCLGMQQIEGYTYYFGSDGILYTGWLKQDGRTYFFAEHGPMMERWLWLAEGRYYLLDGQLLTGWQEIDGRTYFFSEDGLASSGWQEIDGVRYYFDRNAVMASGTVDIDGITYYHREDGPRVTGWQEIDGKRYYFNEAGALVKNSWLTQGEYSYYLREDGTPAVGPTVIDGQTHYFSPKGIEVILVNAMNPVPSYFQQNFVNVVDYHDVDSRCYEALVNMLEDCTAAGIEYEFNSAYRTVLEQTTILEYRTLEHMRDFGLSFAQAREKALDTVAIPGTSEHQLGLAVDLLGKEAIAWFREHCWDYGFIIRYTEEKEHITGIVDEPWHFRYVGTEVSLDMKDSGLCLEEYLGAPPVTDEGVAAVHGDTWFEEKFTTVNAKTMANYTSIRFPTTAK